jgi:hypothetical protein
MQSSSKICSCGEVAMILIPVFDGAEPMCAPCAERAIENEPVEVYSAPVEVRPDLEAESSPPALN